MSQIMSVKNLNEQNIEDYEFQAMSVKTPQREPSENNSQDMDEEHQ